MHAMKVIAIVVVLLLVVVNALGLLPAASAFQMYLSGGAVALSLVALIAILAGRSPSRDNRSGRNPWRACTLEWEAPSPPGHGNFDHKLEVHRGPYEYASPEVPEDFLPQTRKI